jgi:hypothetical protein
MVISVIARRRGGAVLGALLFLARPAFAIEPDAPMRAHSGLQLGARVSYDAPSGGLAGPYVESAPSASDVFGPWYAFGLEAGYRFTPVIYLGGAAVWGPTAGRSGTTQGGSVTQLLFDVRFYLAPESRSGTWLAFDTGWEVATIDAGSGHATYQGPVVANFQLGYDIRGGPFAIAPYVGVAFAEFVTHSLDPEPAGFVAVLDAHMAHEWFTVGVHGSYGPR